MSDVMGDMRFIKVGADGLGRASATTAHAMAYFHGDIYLGTSTGHPKTKEDAPRIYRYRPSEDRWTVVFEPPMTMEDACERCIPGSIRNDYNPTGECVFVSSLDCRHARQNGRSGRACDEPVTGKRPHQCRSPPPSVNTRS